MEFVAQKKTPHCVSLSVFSVMQKSTIMSKKGGEFAPKLTGGIISVPSSFATGKGSLRHPPTRVDNSSNCESHTGWKLVIDSQLLVHSEYI